MEYSWPLTEELTGGNCVDCAVRSGWPALQRGMNCGRCGLPFDDHGAAMIPPAILRRRPRFRVLTALLHLHERGNDRRAEITAATCSTPGGAAAVGKLIAPKQVVCRDHSA